MGARAEAAALKGETDMGVRDMGCGLQGTNKGELINNLSNI